MVFSDDLWEDILDKVHSSSVCARHGLMQCKILHRTHLTKVRLSRIYQNVDSICDRCRQADASYIHMFWTCPALLSYWLKIFDTFSQVTGKDITPNSLVALFGATSSITLLSSTERSFIAFGSLLARCLILLKWKSITPPDHCHWVRDVLYFARLEKIRHLSKGSKEKFSRIWNPFFEYVGKLAFPDNLD